jgi:hypothetical protein
VHRLEVLRIFAEKTGSPISERAGLSGKGWQCRWKDLNLHSFKGTVLQTASTLPVVVTPPSKENYDLTLECVLIASEPSVRFGRRP